MNRGRQRYSLPIIPAPASASPVRHYWPSFAELCMPRSLYDRFSWCVTQAASSRRRSIMRRGTASVSSSPTLLFSSLLRSVLDCDSEAGYSRFGRFQPAPIWPSASPAANQAEY